MMRWRSFRAVPGVLALIAAGLTQSAHALDVRLCTDRGLIELALDERTAPLHARNFARSVADGFYSGTIFHRVVPESIVQGGLYTPDLQRRLPHEPLPGEMRTGLSNLRGTVAAAQPGNAGSTTAQFFINLANNTHLDPTPQAPGYIVFGRVTAGLELLDELARAPTRRAGELTELPLAPVVLSSVTVLDRETTFGLSVQPDAGSLQQAFETALMNGNAATILAAVDGLRRACQTLATRHYAAEAEAAIELNRIERARYSLEQYLANANRSDPQLARLQRLYAGLPQPGSSNVGARIAHCQRPVAPALPDPVDADLFALQATERAMRSYRQTGEFYLRCVAQVIDSGNLSEPEASDATALYNELVIELTAVTTRFNAAARAFKEAND